MHQELLCLASDNTAGAHPHILQALLEANAGDALPYGDDPWTKALSETLQGHFGEQAQAYPVFLGTAANVISLLAITTPWEGIICAPVAHINRDEGGAPEAMGGRKLLPTAGHQDGKITPEGIAPFLASRGFVHHVQPKVVSITQPTELGICYSVKELQALSAFCHANDLLLHMDGARLANACAALDLNLGAITTEVGVDVLSLGGTKNGCLAAEAIVVLRAGLAEGLPFLRKQSMQLASKIRYVSAQLQAMFGTAIWLENARHANALAAALGQAIAALPPDRGVRVVHPIETNAVFVKAPREVMESMRRESFFYYWEDATSDHPVARWMTSWSSDEGMVSQFVKRLTEVCCQE